MENTYFQNETAKKSTGFYLAFLLIFIFLVMGIGIDIDQFLQQKENNISIPTWYFFIIFTLDFLAISAILLMLFYKKIGVYIFPIFILFHFLLHNFYLNTFLYSDVMSLFIYMGVGLLVIIPKWKFYK